MGQYDRLIATLTSDPTDRAAMQALAAGMEDNPMLASRVEAVLRELARPAARPDGTAYTPEECLEYAADFMRVTGIPPELVHSTLSLIGDAEPLDSIATERIEDEALVDHIEHAMKADPDAYAKNPDAQKQYREALDRLNAPRPPEPEGPITGSPAYKEAVRSSDARRRGEIEAAMREDGGRRYWNDAAMQKEYGEILSRQVAPPAMPAAEAPPSVEPATAPATPAPRADTERPAA